MPDNGLGEKDAEKNLALFYNLCNAAVNYPAGLSRYVHDFMLSSFISMTYFNEVEKNKLLHDSPWESYQVYLGLTGYNLDVLQRGMRGAVKMMADYARMEMNKGLSALYNTWWVKDGEDMAAFISRQAKILDVVANVYPQAIEDIEPEFGFHFERDGHPKVAETDRFLLYQILPLKPQTEIRANAKPILILPPYVLGANILGFLPSENRSYAHCFANHGIPVYIRIAKDIASTPALQVMNGEDDAGDTRRFCETIKQRHGKPVTLNGYCQGGFNAVCDLLSGELDGLVDALITCVAPMDGTRSKGLADFLKTLPPRFNDLAYGTKTLPNGNQVADGKLMGWVYKIKSIEQESPLAAFYRDLIMFNRQGTEDVVISKTAAALNYWLIHERFDLPLEITKLSFASYNTPVAADGTLPVKLFGRKLNFKRVQEKAIPWLICYGEQDDLVEQETALAPRDYVDAEVSGFPKGHAAIATSWSDPRSACALHTRFGEKNYRGPVRFQLDLDAQLDQAPGKPKPGPL
ncbi:MAG: metal transporter [Desulfobacterales bacterium]|nr:MAG: metal transporter [Desulfobacterales bacterium]